MSNISIEQRIADYLDMARDLIEKYGHMVQSVFPDNASGAPGYSYTIGLMDQGLNHELLIVGLHPDVAHTLLNDVASQMKAGTDCRGPVRMSQIIENFDVALMPVDLSQTDDGLNVANALQPGRKIELTQVVLPDAQGLFPWENGCDPAFARSQTAIFALSEDAPAAMESRSPRRH